MTHGDVDHEIRRNDYVYVNVNSANISPRLYACQGLFPRLIFRSSVESPVTLHVTGANRCPPASYKMGAIFVPRDGTLHSYAPQETRLKRNVGRARRLIPECALLKANRRRTAVVWTLHRGTHLAITKRQRQRHCSLYRDSFLRYAGNLRRRGGLESACAQTTLQSILRTASLYHFRKR